MLKKALIYVTAILLSSAVQAAGASNEKQRLCKDSDLVGGTWKAIQVVETPPASEMSLYRDIPYQYLTFYAGNRYAYVASNREFATPAKLQKAMQWPEMGNHILQYTLDSQGVLNLYLDKKMLYSYRCVVIKKAQGHFKENDLVLTGYTTRALTQLYKLYRRWF